MQETQETQIQSWGWEDPVEQEMATQSSILCQENPHGWRSLAGYSPWGHKESDMTERLTHTHTTHKDSSSTHKHLSTRYLRNISIMSICLRLLFLLCFLSSLSSFVLVLLCAIWYFPNTSSAIQFQKN